MAIFGDGSANDPLNSFVDGSVSMPADGGTTVDPNASAGAPWWQQPLTYGLNRAVDAEFLLPFTATDPSRAQYGVTPQGSLYTRGQPAGTAAPTSASSLLSNPLVVVAGIVALGVLLFEVLKG